MLRAGALYYAIFVVFIVSLITGFLFLAAYTNQNYFTILFMQGQMVNDVNSAINLHISNPELADYNTSEKLLLYGDSVVKTDIVKKPWGAYDIVHVTSIWKNYTYSKIALTGVNLAKEEPVCLYLADKERYLSVSGNTKLNGNCYLPKLGIRKAYIEGKSYVGKELVADRIKTSEKNLPEPNPVLLEQINLYSGEEEQQEYDSLVSYEGIRTLTIHNSFYNKTLVLFSEGSINLYDMEIKGNIRIISPGRITVNKNTIIENIILYGNEIYINNGFKGTLQAFATDTIVIGEKVLLEYPSYVALVNEGTRNCAISIHEETVIQGGILLYQEEMKENKSILYMEEDVIIEGNVYSSGAVQHKGTIYGGLYCSLFSLKTNVAYYENHLLDATIDPKGISKYFAGGLLFEQHNKNKLITWLN